MPEREFLPAIPAVQHQYCDSDADLLLLPQKKAEQMGTAAGDKNLTETSKQMTELFAAHHPFREAAPTGAP